MNDADLFLEIVDANGNRQRLLAELGCMRTAIAAWMKAAEVYSNERVLLRHRARILRDTSDTRLT